MSASLYEGAMNSYLDMLERDFMLKYGPCHVCGFCKHWTPLIQEKTDGICLKTTNGVDFACREGRKCAMFEARFRPVLDVAPADAGKERRR